MLEIKKNEILANHSTFKIGGPARYFVIVKNKEEIIEAIKFSQEKNLPYFVLAGGSNILFHDEGFDGLIIKVSNFGFRASDLKITAGAGTLLSQVINFAVENNLSGLEWGIGIPGTVGGCVAGNCGAYGHSISESVIKVKTLEKEYLKDECGFFYRKSKFKSRSNLDEKKVRPLPEIILEIELKLEKGNKEESKEEIKNILIKRKNRIPPYPSIGCIFKNPKPLSAGSLIEQCGLKGKQIGGAQIAEQHCNFIVNVGHATSDNVLALINLCKQKVKEKFNINLEEEIVVV
ncbi:UDP-N-acetylmuramate dehydrogenase [Patescibacteria group bacterium]|nr:UDP-N-acetylmuramate dehydrogenase [Patescibacteria group bacterium]